MRIRAGQIFALFVLLCSAPRAAVAADTQLSVELGWGGNVRVGYWQPLFVTAADLTTRNVILDVQWPSGGSYCMRIQQAMTIGPNPRTFPLLVPVHGWQY